MDYADCQLLACLSRRSLEFGACGSDSLCPIAYPISKHGGWTGKREHIDTESKKTLTLCIHPTTETNMSNMKYQRVEIRKILDGCVQSMCLVKAHLYILISSCVNILTGDSHNLLEGKTLPTLYK